jgi:hypothetical protein
MTFKSLPPQTEKEFMGQVVALARLRGWLVYHTHDSRRSPAGFPDLVLVRPRDGRLVFAELKTDRGCLRPAQVLWLEALRQTAAEVYVWRPAQWDEIERCLG